MLAARLPAAAFARDCAKGSFSACPAAKTEGKIFLKYSYFLLSLL